MQLREGNKVWLWRQIDGALVCRGTVVVLMSLAVANNGVPRDTPRCICAVYYRAAGLPIALATDHGEHRLVLLSVVQH